MLKLSESGDDFIFAFEGAVLNLLNDTERRLPLLLVLPSSVHSPGRRRYRRHIYRVVWSSGMHGSSSRCEIETNPDFNSIWLPCVCVFACLSVHVHT